MAPANSIARADVAAGKAGNPASMPPALLLAEIERLKAEIARAESRISELEARADTDPLLDIRNRRGFMRELKRSIAHLQRYKGEAALLFIDLDGFKAVNDIHGHAAGDAILKAVAHEAHRQCARLRYRGAAGRRRILRAVVESGGRACRGQGARVGTADRSGGRAYGETLLSVGASAGVVQLAAEAVPEQVIDAADKAMYERKTVRKRGR